MNRTYNLKLDLQFRCNNSNMEFWQFDENTSDFYIRITNNGQLFDIEKAIVILAVIKPNGSVDSQFIEVKNGLLYADLKPSMKDEVGNYQTRALLIFEDEKLTTDIMTYTVNADNILSALNVAAATTQEFTLLTDMLSRLSTIELNEVNRQDNFKLLQQEWDKLKVEFDNYVYVKVDERVDEVIVPIVDTKVENLTNQVVIDLTDRIAKADNKMLVVDDKIAEVNNTISNKVIEVDNAITKIPPKEELIGPQGIQGIQGIQGPRGDMGPQGLKGDKGDKGDIGPQGIQGVQGYKGDKGDIGPQGIQGPTGSASVSINDNVTNTETTWSSSKIGSYVNTIYTPVEGTYISVDSIDGWVENVQILGNTYQGTDLSIIKSVGDKMPDGRFKIPLLCTGKNLLSSATLIRKNGAGDNFAITKNYFNVKSNTAYTVQLGSSVHMITLVCYDKNLNLLGNVSTNYSSFTTCTLTTKENTKYVQIMLQKDANIDLTTPIKQLEEGTVATSIESYLEHQITILSDVQIEKVGTVADRIVEKDKVWGTEKNNVDVVFDGSENWEVMDDAKVNTIAFYVRKTVKQLPVVFALSSYGNVENTTIYNKDTESIAIISDDRFHIQVRVLRTKAPSLIAFKESLKTNKLLIKYPTTTPKFTPLSDDQQVALRTFANRTNILSLCEIEPTVKCDVPKSTQASINSINLHLDNVDKDLERVKKLEDATNSTVIDDGKGFVSISDTSNGYLSDIKIEGRTLNNILSKTFTKASMVTNSYASIFSSEYPIRIEVGKTYTIIPYSNISASLNGYHYSYVKNDNAEGTLTSAIATTITKFTCPSDFKAFRFYADLKNDVTNAEFKFLIVEGDYTQNPPSGYIEGLKSVGQDTTKIVVSSVKADGNLIDESKLTLGYTFLTSGLIANPSANVSDYIRVSKGDSFIVPSGINSSTSGIGCFDLNKNLIKVIGMSSPIDTSQKFTVDFDGYVRVTLWKTQSMMMFKGATLKSYKPYETDKKELLYLDTVDSTWKKPVFRGLWNNGIMTIGDVAEKKSDGKYSYRKRMLEKVINGSETGWAINATYTNTIRFVCSDILPSNNFTYTTTPITALSDKFEILSASNSSLMDKDCISQHSAQLTCINISKSRLATQDVAGFKAWLQANPVTLVYQLLTELVYECTPIDVASFDSETNYYLESGVLSPRSTIKVQNFLGSIINNLKEQVSVLQNKVYTDNMLMKAMLLNHETRLVLGGH